MKIDVWLHWENRDSNGKLISRSRKKKAKSFTKHLINKMYCEFANTTMASQTNVTDGSGTFNGSQPLLNAASGDDSFGPVVGSGSTAVSISNTKLVTKIAQATLAHGATTFTAATTVGNSQKFTIQRTFTNNSGGTVTVNEVGLYISDVLGKWLIERTLSTRAIDNATTATLTYTIQVTV